MAASSGPEYKDPLSISSDKKWNRFHLYQGFWVPVKFLSAIMACSEKFEASKDDIIISTMPKSGTTWLKALTFSVLYRTRHDLHNHPLLSNNPHDLVPCLELQFNPEGESPDHRNLPSPYLFQSHFPYEGLPTSIIESNCRIIYLCRNPKDTFVSWWHFINELLVHEDEPPISLEETFEFFIRGISFYGPFWEHLLGYWKASLERPEKVLFMKYEELKEDPTFHLKRLAEFLGFPFSVEEEREGLVEKIERLCCFESLTSFEVNYSGNRRDGLPFKKFFRRGVVGDWKNHLTVEMIDTLDQLSQQKLEPRGLTFKDV